MSTNPMISQDLIERVRQALPITWPLLGKPKTTLAKEAGVPFEDRRFWPAIYCFGSDRLPKAWTVNRTICPELYASKVGDVVPVFVTEDGSTAHYTVLGFSWASGSDHIVSPREFHIRFATLIAIQSSETK